MSTKLYIDQALITTFLTSKLRWPKYPNIHIFFMCRWVDRVVVLPRLVNWISGRGRVMVGDARTSTDGNWTSFIRYGSAVDSNSENGPKLEDIFIHASSVMLTNINLKGFSDGLWWLSDRFMAWRHQCESNHYTWEQRSRRAASKNI